MKLNESGKAYITLPGHPNVGVHGCIAKTLQLDDICKGGKGPRVLCDFNNDGLHMRIEILA